MNGPLAGRRVLVTRAQPGELARLLESRGAVAVHVPLIAIVEPDDDGGALRHELARLDDYDWLIVTSAPGAERVAAAVAAHPDVELAAVGTATARALRDGAGRGADIVPQVQTAGELAREFARRVPPTKRILVAQADRAGSELVDHLRRIGHDVTVVTAYRTIAQAPNLVAVGDADAVAFASGSAVESWVHALGRTCPAISVAIGPSTAATADRLGLKLSGVAADHSLDGLVNELERQFAASTPAGQ